MENLTLTNQIKSENDLKFVLNQIDIENKNELKRHNKFFDDLNCEICTFEKTILQKQNQIDFLVEPRNVALKNFNLIFADNLNKKIENLKKEIEKINLEINQKKQEKIFEMAKEGNIQKSFDLNNKSFEEVENFGNEILNQKLQNQKFALVFDFFKNFPKQEAVKVLLNGTFYLDHLGFCNLAKCLKEL